MDTNIKNLPDGKYFTELMYTDRHAWRVVKETPKTVLVQSVDVDNDPEWIEARNKAFMPGGFFGHQPNQSAQTWLYKGLGSETRRLYKGVRGWVCKGTYYREDTAREFYDYNF
jgi:hypothetical protein